MNDGFSNIGWQQLAKIDARQPPAWHSFAVGAIAIIAAVATIIAH